MNTWIAKVLLRLSVWLFDFVFEAVDKNKDGKIDKLELFDAVKYLDNTTRSLIKKLK